MPRKGSAPTGEGGSTLSEQLDKLPHERDETPETTPSVATPNRGVIEQAESDVRHGQVDTDNYTRARNVTRNGTAARSRRR